MGKDMGALARQQAGRLASKEKLGSYAQGIEAFKEGKAKGENPYAGKSIGFGDFLCNPRIFSQQNPYLDKARWDQGWDFACDLDKRFGSKSKGAPKG